jgi:cysteine desulfurase/selenocysteine lyase
MEPEEIGGGTIAAVTAEDYMLRSDHRSWRWDAGTPNIIGLIGLGAGVQYLERIGIHRVEQHERELTRHLLEGLLENPKVEIYGPTENLDVKAGAVGFNLQGWRCHDVSLALDSKWRILTRGGHHCCQPMMRFLGIWDTYSGNVRASFHFYNTAKEVDALIEALKTLSG